MDKNDLKEISADIERLTAAVLTNAVYTAELLAVAKGEIPITVKAENDVLRQFAVFREKLGIL